MIIGVMAFDSDPAGILGNTMQRDTPLFADDRFMATIETYLSGRGGCFRSESRPPGHQFPARSWW